MNGTGGRLCAGCNFKEGLLLRSYSTADGVLLRPEVYEWTDQVILLIKFSKKNSVSKATLGLPDGTSDKAWKEEAARVLRDTLASVLRAGVLRQLQLQYPQKLAPAIIVIQEEKFWSSKAKTAGGLVERVEFRIVLKAHDDISVGEIKEAIRDRDSVMKLIREEPGQWANDGERQKFEAIMKDSTWEALHYAHGMSLTFLYV